MSLSIFLNESLPQFAWLAQIDTIDLSVNAVLGRSVEYGQDFLTAGVWNGTFADGRFEDTDCFFGTGLVARDESVTVVPSAATSDPIFFVESGRLLIVANSLPLLLGAIGDQLDPQFPGYHRITESIHAGINKYVKGIPTIKGQIQRLFVRNLVVQRARYFELDKTLPPNFTTFTDYLHYFDNNFAEICKNIRDPQRRVQLDIISTQSRGYDSTAINTIAAKYMLDNVFTVREAKQEGDFVSHNSRPQEADDGSEICANLGLNCTPLTRRLYISSFEEEGLFYASDAYAYSANFLGIKPYLRRPSVMLTGLLGDIIWATEIYYQGHRELLKNPSADIGDAGRSILPEDLSDDLAGSDTWLNGVAEIGLEWGLIQFPPAFIGGRRLPDVYRITMSGEMAPWRLGSDYDRPIPRRIGEEIGGLPRGMFGQTKMATVTEFPVPPVPIGSKLRQEYFTFLRENNLLSHLFGPLTYRVVHKVNKRLVYHTPYRYRYIYYAERLLSRLTGREIAVPWVCSSLNARLYTFCVNGRAAEYAKSLAGWVAGGRRRDNEDGSRPPIPRLDPQSRHVAEA
jgi:hypothetical protein